MGPRPIGPGALGLGPDPSLPGGPLCTGYLVEIVVTATLIVVEVTRMTVLPTTLRPWTLSAFSAASLAAMTSVVVTLTTVVVRLYMMVALVVDFLVRIVYPQCTPIASPSSKKLHENNHGF